VRSDGPVQNGENSLVFLSNWLPRAFERAEANGKGSQEEFEGERSGGGWFGGGRKKNTKFVQSGKGLKGKLLRT